MSLFEQRRVGGLAGEEQQLLPARKIRQTGGGSLAPQRIQIISYGEERPFSIGSGESSWRLNRRSHFVIVAR